MEAEFVFMEKLWKTDKFQLRLGYRKESPGINVATEAYPCRWTHHVMVGSVDEIDGERMDWIQEVAEFAAAKGRIK